MTITHEPDAFAPQPVPLLKENQNLSEAELGEEQRIGFVDVGEGYQLQYEIHGDMDSKVVIISQHGGPGQAYDDSHVDFYPPECKVIVWTQRGVKPGVRPDEYGLENNTLENSVDDLTKIADALGFEQYFLAGGSWGSAVSLAHAIKYPERVKALLLWGVYTGQPENFDDAVGPEAQAFAPLHFQKLIEDVPEDQRGSYKEIMAFHYGRVMEKDENGLPTVAAKRSAVAYAFWQLKLAEPAEGNISEKDAFLYSQLNDPNTIATPGEAIFDLFDSIGFKSSESMILEAVQPLHYIVNDSFMTDELNPMLPENAAKLADKLHLVIGTEDHNTLPKVAEALFNAVPNPSGRSTKREVRGGHLRTDTGVNDALHEESYEMVKQDLVS